jgi:glutamate synthase domain-containing protein 3
MVFQEKKMMTQISPKFLPRIYIKNNVYKVNADSMHYRELNALLRELDNKGAEKIEIDNVYGQRYIGTNLKNKLKIDIYGTPGNDLGAFMDGPKYSGSRERTRLHR